MRRESQTWWKGDENAQRIQAHKRLDEHIEPEEPERRPESKGVRSPGQARGKGYEEERQRRGECKVIRGASGREGVHKSKECDGKNMERMRKEGGRRTSRSRKSTCRSVS